MSGALGSPSLIRAARASAALDGRDYVLPDDVQSLAASVLAHRLLPTAQAQLNRRTPEQVVAILNGASIIRGFRVVEFQIRTYLNFQHIVRDG